ncbi:MAG: hypothetical protein ABWY18_19305 [Tardiphaga sp.]
MSASFYTADKPTHRRVMLVGCLFCMMFIGVSFYARPQPENDHVLLKADKLVRAANRPLAAN